VGPPYTRASAKGDIGLELVRTVALHTTKLEKATYESCDGCDLVDRKLAEFYGRRTKEERQLFSRRYPDKTVVFFETEFCSIIV
jgi:hypothetical protein